MQQDEIEFLDAYDQLTKIISEKDFHALEHKFFRSYYVDFEYTLRDNCILMKCDHEDLRVEMIFYHLDLKRVTESFAYRFTQSDAYFEWMEHLTNLHFKEAMFCKDNYGHIKVRPETLEMVHSSMRDRDSKTGERPYQWV